MVKWTGTRTAFTRRGLNRHFEENENEREDGETLSELPRAGERLHMPV